MVHRYSIDSTGRPWRHPEGLYVWHSDFDALADELAEAERLLLQAEGQLYTLLHVDLHGIPPDSLLMKIRAHFAADSAPAAHRHAYKHNADDSYGICECGKAFKVCPSCGTEIDATVTVNAAQGTP